jgi:CCR4-NOT transcription complex subunit 7/8
MISFLFLSSYFHATVGFDIETCLVRLGPRYVTFIAYSQDTEFPGVVARPIGNFRTSADYHYQTLRCNVDLLKIIQLGISFADENGHLPKDVCTWQFNFKFNLTYVFLYIFFSLKC